MAESIGVVDILLPISLAIVLVYRRTWSLSEIALYGFLVLLAAGIAFGSLAVDVAYVLKVLRLVAIFLAFSVAARMPKLADSLAERMVKLFLVGSFISTLLSAYFFYAGVQISSSQQALYFGESVLLRAASLAGNTAEFGLLVGLMTLVGVIFSLERISSNLAKSASLLFLIAYGSHLALISSSRGAILCFVTGILSYLVLAGRLRYLPYFLLVAVAVWFGSSIVGHTILGFELDLWLKRFLFWENLNEDFSSGRIHTWLLAVEAIADNPFGLGYKTAMSTLGAPVDNSLISIDLEAGLVGL